MPELRRRLPPPNSLIVFEAAARRLSFSLAAEELHITQAAVSRQIRRLEENLGRRLFRRQHRQVALTDAGREMQRVVSSGLGAIADTAEGLRAHSGGRQVTLATTIGLATFWLMPRLDDFRRLHPDLDVRVLAVDRDVDPAGREADIALRFARRGQLRSHARLLFEEEIFPVCNPSLFEGRELPVDLQAIRVSTLLHLDGAHWQGIVGDPIDWSSWLAHFGVSLPPDPHGLTLNNYPLLIQAALAGQGLALGWRPMVQPLLDNGLLIRPVAESWMTDRGYYLDVGAANPRPGVAAFRDWLQARVSANEGSR